MGRLLDSAKDLADQLERASRAAGDLQATTPAGSIAVGPASPNVTYNIFPPREPVRIGGGSGQKIGGGVGTIGGGAGAGGGDGGGVVGMSEFERFLRRLGVFNFEKLSRAMQEGLQRQFEEFMKKLEKDPAILLRSGGGG